MSTRTNDIDDVTRLTWTRLQDAARSSADASGDVSRSSARRVGGCVAIAGRRSTFVDDHRYVAVRARWGDEHDRLRARSGCVAEDRVLDKYAPARRPLRVIAGQDRTQHGMCKRYSPTTRTAFPLKSSRDGIRVAHRRERRRQCVDGHHPVGRRRAPSTSSSGPSRPAIRYGARAMTMRSPAAIVGLMLPRSHGRRRDIDLSSIRP